jgi:hypothetical protein
LEAITAPDAQNSEEQQALAEKINKLLIHDGYSLTIAGRISGSPKEPLNSTLGWRGE